MFGRKKKNAAAAGADDIDTEEIPEDRQDSGDEDVEEVEEVEDVEEPSYDRGEGPFDADEAEDGDAANVLDLGSVRIPMTEGMEVRVEVDEGTGQPAAITLVHGEGAVQVRAFACPRSGGLWQEARGDIVEQITRDGGSIEEVSGLFGAELSATVGMRDPEGNSVVQPIRFVAVEGPRWMLQGVFLGQGTDPDAAHDLNAIFRSLVVVRGDSPMPKGQAIPIVLPENVQREVEEVEEEAVED